MQRSKKIIVTSNCILNQNAVVKKSARSSGIMKSAIDWCYEQEYGIIQLPCPEFTYLGPDRPGMTREQYDTNDFREHCRTILRPTIEQLKVYQKHGYTIVGGIGIAGSPSCDPGKGVFMEEFHALVTDNDINIDFFWQIPRTQEGHFDPEDEKSIFGKISQ
jgi:predicted secreted protein